MTTLRFSISAVISFGHNLFDRARPYLVGRRGMFVLGILMLVGIGLSWSWLTAVGIAPILLAALPCLAMCGLGMCMNKLIGSSCASGAQQQASPREPFNQELQ